MSDAAEALKALSKWLEAKSPPFSDAAKAVWINAATIRHALQILSRIERGETKEMGREPTDRMWQAGFEANDKQYSGDPLDDMIAKTKATYTAAWDAAPRIAATEGESNGNAGLQL